MCTDMSLRIVVTASAWFLWPAFVASDGQTFRNAIAILVAAVIGGLPWIRPAFRPRGVQYRIVAIVIVALSTIVIIFIICTLPAAYESQCRFNQRFGKRATGNMVNVSSEYGAFTRAP